MAVAPDRWSRRWTKRWYARYPHPIHLLDAQLKAVITPTTHALEIGCGRDAPVLRKFADQFAHAHGVEPEGVDPRHAHPKLTFHRGYAEQLPLPEASIDLAFARSVWEHLPDPNAATSELARVVRPGGTVLILTPNLWDYVSLISHCVPNVWHAPMLGTLGERKAETVFPTHYKANTAGAIRRLAKQHGFETVRLEHLSQAPHYLRFSTAAYTLGCAYAELTQLAMFKYLRAWLLVEWRRR